MTKKMLVLEFEKFKCIIFSYRNSPKKLSEMLIIYVGLLAVPTGYGHSKTRVVARRVQNLPCAHPRDGSFVQATRVTRR